MSVPRNVDPPAAAGSDDLVAEVAECLATLRAGSWRPRAALHLVQLRPELWLGSSDEARWPSGPLHEHRVELEEALLAAVLRYPASLRVRRLMLYDLPSDLAPEARHEELAGALSRWRAQVTRGLTALGLRSDRSALHGATADLDVRVVILGRADTANHAEVEAALPPDGAFWGYRDPRVPGFYRAWEHASRDYTRASLRDWLPSEDRHPAAVVQRDLGSG